MPVLTEATILKREAQAVEVMALSFRGGLTQEAACEEVGISEDVYRDWIRKSPILVTSLRDFIDGAHYRIHRGVHAAAHFRTQPDLILKWRPTRQTALSP